MSSLTTASLEEIREVAARICRDYLTGQWKNIRASDINVKRISGGLSNFLYHVSLPESGSNSYATSVTGISQRPKLGGNDRKRIRTNSGEINAAPSSGCVQSNVWEEPREVLLRIYGQTHGENALEAMITESVVFALLSERNFGPKLHGIFPGGRIEQYIPARALVTSQLNDHKISIKIAEKMAEIHSLNIPMSKEPNWLWNCMDRWLKSINNILEEASRKNNIDGVEEVSSMDFLGEIKWLKSVVRFENYPVLFCHNDLQEGNILLREATAMDFDTVHLPLCNPSSTIGQISNFDDSAMAVSDDINMLEEESNANIILHESSIGNSGRLSSADVDNTRDSLLSNSSNDPDMDPDLIIIDFEYCAYNYRGFDLANHFLEWTFDYSNPEFPYFYHRKNQYPTNKQRYDFIISYLRRLKDSNVITMDEVLAVDNEVQIFSMFSHFFWTLWSVVNSTSNIEFGYWNYALTRIREYKQLKQEYLEKCC